VEENGVTRENHWPVTSHWQTLSHNVVSNTHRLSGIQTHNYFAMMWTYAVIKKTAGNINKITVKPVLRGSPLGQGPLCVVGFTTTYVISAYHANKICLTWYIHVPVHSSNHTYTTGNIVGNINTPPGITAIIISGAACIIWLGICNTKHEYSQTFSCLYFVFALYNRTCIKRSPLG
jgi:hypothetical protein